MIHAWLLVLLFLCASCDNTESSNTVQAEQQEKVLREGTSSIGMPAIHNFRERRLLKQILELRDQTNLITYTYTFSETTGKLTFFCDSIGYGIPYATQYTSPQKFERCCASCNPEPMPQADPNGLFSPQSAEGTWVMCKDPSGPDVRPLYVEPRIVVSPFKLPQ